MQDPEGAAHLSHKFVSAASVKVEIGFFFSAKFCVSRPISVIPRVFIVFAQKSLKLPSIG